MFGPAYASCPGRVCLVGEHLDWIKGPVIACAVDRLRVFDCVREPQNEECTTIRSRAPFDIAIQFNALDNTIHYTGGKLDYVIAVFNALKSQGYRNRIGNVDIEIRTTLLPGAGLSSSAALGVALVKALDMKFDLGLTPREICALAYQAEAKNLVTGCGQMDMYAGGLGGLIMLDCSTDPPRHIESLKIRDDVRIIIGDTGELRNVREIISVLQQRWARNDPLMRKYVRSTQDALSATYELLRRDDWDPCEVGHLLTDCHHYLRDYADLSTNQVERLVSAALGAGAYGAKLTGAGKGGSIFALASVQQAPRVAEAMAAAGAKAVYVTCIAPQGVMPIDGAAFEHVSPNALVGDFAQATNAVPIGAA